MRATDLRKFEGCLCVLRFNDGHTVKARLVHVDVDDRNEVIYDVVEVLATGEPPEGSVKPGTTAADPLADIADFSILKEE